MSAFEDFVQVELPKRGYLNQDPAQETVIVRRGAGPRQFDAVQLQEGQVLAYVNGQLAGVNLAGAVAQYETGIRKAIVPVATPAVTWTINHNFNSENVIVQAFDENKSVIFPDAITIDDANTITISFNTFQAGTARILFLD